MATTNLEGQLREQLTASIKAKDLKTANLIRMINTKIMERRTAKGFSGTVDDVQSVPACRTDADCSFRCLSHPGQTRGFGPRSPSAPHEISRNSRSCRQMAVHDCSFT